jgi:secreted trypsin-like serine protease
MAVKSFIFVVSLVYGVLGAVNTVPAIMNGQFDGDLHPYVGVVNHGVNFCSGALISPKVFVTAAHCFFEQGNEVRVSVTFDPETDGPGPAPEKMHSGTWYHHEDFCEGCGSGLPDFDNHDVAVVVLDKPVKLSEYAELPTPGIVDTLPMGTQVTVVGYGAQYINVGHGNPYFVFLFDRYFATTELIASEHEISDEFIKLTANPAQDKGGGCFGDSGGPNLLGDTKIILSITSFGANPLCRGVGYSNRIDTDYALEFIKSFLKK